MQQFKLISISTLFRSNLDSIESNKDLLALHNGAWASHEVNRLDPMGVGQDKIVRIFSELMRNMSRMKTYIRPSMCKPYGKQSESLQKSEFQSNPSIYFVLSISNLSQLSWTPFRLCRHCVTACRLLTFPCRRGKAKARVASASELALASLLAWG